MSATSPQTASEPTSNHLKVVVIAGTKLASVVCTVLFLVVLSPFACAADSSASQNPQVTSASEKKTDTGGVLSPEDYVVSKFQGHQIIFLGEMHSVRQNLEFLEHLIPKLYEAGIYNLGYEFASYADQPKIDRLVSANSYDEHVALEVLWRCCDLKWVTQEYADVFKAVWELNHRLPAGARRFRIIGLDNNSDSDPTVTSTNGITDGPTSLNNFDFGNFFWAQVIDKEVLRKNDKALVYTGVGHSYTRFFHQRSEDNGRTVGNVIYNGIGAKAFTINLHGSSSDGRVELARRVDKIFAALPPSRRRTGFDTKSSPLGNLPVKANGYLYREGRCSGFKLSDITDGYIYLASIDEWKSVTFRADFLTPANYEQVEQKWRSDRQREKRYTIEEMKSLAEAAIHNQFLYQQGRLPGNE